MSADEWVGWTMALAAILTLIVGVTRVWVEHRQERAVTERMVGLVHEYAATDPRVSS